MNDAPRSVKELPLSCFPSLNEGWQTAKPGSEHEIDLMIRTLINTHGLSLPGEGGGANTARARSRKRGVMV